MIRLVVGVALALALVGASLPPLAEARVDRSATLLEAELDRLARTAAVLVAESDPVAAGPGARRIVTLELPGRSLTSAAVAWVELRGDEDAAVYRLPGRPPTAVPLGVALRTPDGPVRLVDPGDHRVTLSLRRVDGDAVVVAARG